MLRDQLQSQGTVQLPEDLQGKKKKKRGDENVIRMDVERLVTISRDSIAAGRSPGKEEEEEERG